MGDPPKLDAATADRIELLKRLMLCHADIQLSLSAITFLAEECDAEETYNYVELRRFKCFETTFIVSYGRAFTNSKGSRYNKLSLKKIGVALTDKECNLHERILHARHRKYAHSDLEKAHARIDLHTIDIGDEDFSFPRVQWDEGLDFVKSIELHCIMQLQHKLLSGLVNRSRELAIELKDYLPIYLQPRGAD